MTAETKIVLRCSKCGETFPATDPGRGRANMHVGRHSGNGFNTAEIREVEVSVTDEATPTSLYNFED